MNKLLYSPEGKIYIKVKTPLTSFYIDITKPEEVMTDSYVDLGLPVLPNIGYLNILTHREDCSGSDFAKPLLYSNL